VLAAIDEFASYCGGGTELWGVSLCGPLIFVDPSTRRAIASADPGVGDFGREGVIWVGQLPANVSVANTSVELGGRRFAEITLPLPTDALNRRVLLAHESFHRIQPELGFTGQEADNSHLDTTDGRIWARMEMAALRAALGDKDWRPPARDALAFRAKRLALFPHAEEGESKLIANEGLAEYTGVKVGAGANADDFAIKRLETGADRPSLIRTFGYVVGPAYGLLLDRLSANWRPAALKGRPLPELLNEALLPPHEATETDYGKDRIVAEETERDDRIQQRRRVLTEKLIDGPTVTFPGSDLQLDFDPNTLFSMGKAGIVYGRETSIRGNWGFLKATGDVLLAPGWSYARVQGPAHVQNNLVVGPGWSAELLPGYWLVPDKKSGSFIVQKQ
jgi:hypothetical protein